ncbi:hypothetical protein [Variovorax saccharolyticus]|uniref:hypothetical protein n=1 Tax=Variovorax saccharolyticus TaxID=3053516 RepID=UPI0025782113|nr:hypothetical protein [Variovorax sp. J31P216]
MLIAALVSLAGCSPEDPIEKHRTVAEYLHDIDAANADLNYYSNDRGKYKGNANWINASSAANKIQFLDECWFKKDADRFTTSNTDHACLDAKGFKR